MLNVDDYLDYVTNRALVDLSDDIKRALEDLWSSSAVAGSDKAARQFALSCARCGLPDGCLGLGALFRRCEAPPRGHLIPRRTYSHLVPARGPQATNHATQLATRREAISINTCDSFNAFPVPFSLASASSQHAPTTQGLSHKSAG